MPPVLGPASPSPARLKSCAGCSGSDRRAVGDREERHLGAVEELLDHHLRVVAAGEAGARVRERLVAVGGDDDALAGGQSVVLDDVRAGRTGRAPRPPRRPSCTRGPSRSGTPASAMTCLANALLPSSRAAAADGPKHAMPRARTASATPATSGTSGPITTRSGCSARRPASATDSALGHVDRAGRRRLGDPGVAGRGHDLRHRVVGQQGRDEGVLASTGSDDEDLHAISLLMRPSVVAGAGYPRTATSDEASDG